MQSYSAIDLSYFVLYFISTSNVLFKVSLHKCKRFLLLLFGISCRVASRICFLEKFLISNLS